MDVNLRFPYVIAFFGLAIGLPLTANGFWLYGVPALIAASLALWREYKFDPEVPCLFVGIIFSGALFLHIVVLVLLGTDNIPLSGLIFLLLLGACGGGFIGWRAQRPSVKGLPDILEELRSDRILETNEVQWVVETNSERLNSHSEVQLTLQNCVNARRTCTISFEEDSRAKPGKGYFTYPEPFVVEIKAGEVVQCLVPVRPTHRDKAELKLFVRLDVKGPRGRRNRKSRGHQVQNRVSSTQQVLALAGGMLVWGGGVALRFERDVNAKASPAEVLVVRQKSIWKPGGRS